MVSEGGVMIWTPGPARCRSDEYTNAEVLADDMGGECPILFRFMRPGATQFDFALCRENGRVNCSMELPFDLMPPRITRETLAEEVLKKYGAPQPCTAHEQAMAVVAHVIDAVKSGRVE